LRYNSVYLVPRYFQHARGETSTDYRSTAELEYLRASILDLNSSSSHGGREENGTERQREIEPYIVP